MKKTFDPEARVAMCHALGIPDPENVRRFVIDVQTGEATRVYVERFADEQAIAEVLPALMTGEPVQYVRPDTVPELGPQDDLIVSADLDLSAQEYADLQNRWRESLVVVRGAGGGSLVVLDGSQFQPLAVRRRAGVASGA